ncbi:MAG TPA: UbiA family prenyltransferase [Candidatus Heimdallarchaeota archaeon]|nr:UbiA family prenyltransferase [Candidatus Heimdallarchaeota archaeon]
MTSASKMFKTKASIITAGLLYSPPSKFHVAAQKPHFNIMSVGFWKASWLTMRPYLIFVSGAAGLVGLAFIESPNAARTLLAFFPLFISYGLGQALTDCFQTDTDAISSPYRPLVKGIISKKQVLGISLSGLLLGILILAYLNPFILILGVVAVLGLLGYTFFKKRWWAGPFWNSWIVALLPIIGKMTDKEDYLAYVSQKAVYLSSAFIFAVAAIFFGYGNFVVMGYLKDITADRETGYRTFPVVFGWKATAIYSDILAVAAAVFTASALYKAHTNIFGVSIFLVAIAVNAFAQIKIHLTRDESMAHGPIANVVRAFILYALAIVVTLKPEWLGFIAVFYLIFEAALKYRPEKTQV